MKGEIIMAYTKKTWVKGNTPLSAENFNHMEQGIADAHTDIAQLNSDMSNLKFDIIRLSGTTDEYGQLWVGVPNIELDKVTYIDCLTSTFSRSIAPYGIINLESIENDGLKFRLIATNNSTFNNYSIDKNVFVVYKY